MTTKNHIVVSLEIDDGGYLANLERLLKELKSIVYKANKRKMKSRVTKKRIQK